MVQGMAVNPPKAPGRGGKVEGFTTWLQARKDSNLKSQVVLLKA